MKTSNSFGIPHFLSAGTIETTGLLERTSPTKRNNPQLERFRNSIKDTLFVSENPLSLKTTRTQSTPSTEVKSTGDLEAIMKKDALSISPNNSRLEKFRNSVKGSLFQLSHKNSSVSPCSNEQDGNSGRLLIQPVEISNDSFMTEEGRSKIEDSSPDQVSKGKNDESTSNFDSPESQDEEESPYGKVEVVVSLPRDSLFLSSMASEMEELKNELNLGEESKIYFIQGNFSKHYKEGEVLGEGTSGVVKKCVRAKTSEEYAVKIIQYKGDMEILTLIIKEFENLKKLNHKNVIKVYELYVDYFKKKIYTIMELADCREMFEVLKDLGHYSEAVASGILKQILTGINYLHLNGVCHRDIKPNNILVSSDGKIVKITDFNVSKFLDKKAQKNKYSSLSHENYKMWTYTGTIAFTAPEVFIDSEYTESVDVWSAGVVLYMMLCGYQPFQATTVKDLIELIKEGKYTFHPEHWDGISDQAKDLIKHCLDVNCKTRYSPADALVHPWIANQGKLSDTKITIKNNFRVYYKKCQDNKNQTCAVEMKKIQVTSPNIAVASPAAFRLKKRSGTFRVMEKYSKSYNKPLALKYIRSDEEIKETISSVFEDQNEESPLQRFAKFEPDDLEILTALDQDKSCDSESSESRKHQDENKALQERSNEPATLKLSLVANTGEGEKQKSVESLRDSEEITENNNQDLIILMKEN